MKQQNNPIRFAITFVMLFVVFYYFNISYFSLTTPTSQHYNLFLDQHFNYIQVLRWMLLSGTALLLKCMGYSAIFNNYDLLVAGHGTIQVVYACLGLGIVSFFIAFIIAYPKPLKSKLIAIIVGVVVIEFLNIIRFAILALYGNNANQLIDHHTLFNIIMYIVICAGLYFWIKQDMDVTNRHEAN
jgi:exosortase/archaeosortase family protein